MRAPFQDGDFPGPVKYGYLNVGRRRAGPARAARPHRLLPAPPPDGVRRPGVGGRAWCRRTCPWPAPCSPASSRRRSTRSGTPPPLLGDRVAVVGAGALGLLRGAAARPDAGRRRSPWSTSTRPGPRSPPRSAWTSRCPTTRRPGATWWCTPVRRPRGCSASLDLLAPEGTVRRAELVRRRPDDGLARRQLPLRPAHRSAPARWAGWRPRGVPAGPRRDRLALALDLLRDAGLRLPADRRVALRRPARGDAAAGQRRAAGAVPLDDLRRTEEVPCSA